MTRLPTPEEWQAKWQLAHRERAERLGLTVEELDRQEEAEKLEAAKRRAESTEREFRRNVIGAGVPSRTFQAATNPVDTPAIREIWCDRDIIVLAGKPGVGKSVAAAIWLLATAARWEYCQQSLRWVQAGALARGYAYEQEAFDSVAKPIALVIDDLGLEYLDQKDRYLATLEEILSLRYANERKTLLTTNLTPEAFKERYGDRIVSRIAEDGAFIVCGGEDLRRAQS